MSEIKLVLDGVPESEQTPAQREELAVTTRQVLTEVERLTPEVFQRVTGQDKAMCANVDLYSGLVYKMMDIPPELYTPLFAIARIVGWCAHRVEEVYNTSGRIIRPAYKAISPKRTFVPLDQR